MKRSDENTAQYRLCTTWIYDKCELLIFCDVRPSKNIWLDIHFCERQFLAILYRNPS